MSPLGMSLRRLRETNNVTQDALAKMLFVTRQTISNWESGKSRPSLEYIYKIADVFNIETSLIVEGEPYYSTLKKEDCTTSIIYKNLFKSKLLINELAVNTRQIKILKIVAIAILAYLVLELTLMPILFKSLLAAGGMNFYIARSIIRPIGFVLIGIFATGIFDALYQISNINKLATKIFKIVPNLFMLTYIVFMMMYLTHSSIGARLYFIALDAAKYGIVFLIPGILIYLGYLKSSDTNFEKIEDLELELVKN